MQDRIGGVNLEYATLGRSSWRRSSAGTRHLAGLHHGSVLLLEALVDALGSLHELVEAAVHAAGFLRNEGLGGEVVDAVVEAALDNGRVDLRSVRQFRCSSRGHGVGYGTNIAWLENDGQRGSWDCSRSKQRCIYPHKFLHLLLLHASGELLLLG